MNSAKGKILLAAVAICAASTGAFAAPGLPDEIKKQLSEHLPAAFSPVPATGSNKIFPAISEKRRSYDRSYAITLGDTPFAITAIGEDGKMVEMSVPAGLHTSEKTNRWFKAEDVFGKVKWKLEPYTPDMPCLAYFSGRKNLPELVAKIPSGTPCALLGTVQSGKTAMKLVQIRRAYSLDGTETEFMIVSIRENPPVKTKEEYDARAKQLMAENAFRSGRPWGEMFPSVLGNEGCFECAAMAADFVTYMFDGGLRTGDRFEKAEEIRSGDMIRMKGHFFAVIYRKGGQLTTIEGNMNKSVCQSSTRYSMKDGKLHCGGKEVEFEYGYHNGGDFLAQPAGKTRPQKRK